MNQVNQVADMERRVRRIEAALQAVPLAIMKDRSNHGTLRRHC